MLRLLSFVILFVFLSCQESPKENAISSNPSSAIEPMKDESAAIRQELSRQQEAWNTGNIDAFMEGYWKSDSLRFISSKGITYGWQATIDGYKKRYPDKATMGKLDFDIILLEQLAADAYHMIGTYALARKEKEDLKGYFTLLWKKIDEHWVIVQDHTS